jgi:hypothetical protein
VEEKGDIRGSHPSQNPDFLSDFVALTNSMRLSEKKQVLD